MTTIRSVNTRVVLVVGDKQAHHFQVLLDALDLQFELLAETSG